MCGYLLNKKIYVTKDGRKTKRGLWANVYLKKKREEKLEKGGKIEGKNGDVRKSWRKGKKLAVYMNGWHHFGDSSMQDYRTHQSEKRRKAYYDRHKKNLEGDSDRAKAFRIYSKKTWQKGGNVKEDYVSMYGYKRYSPFVNEEMLTIHTPDGKITMEDVDFPILAIDENGKKKIMQPGQKYQFNSKKIIEIPMKNLKQAQTGKKVANPFFSTSLSSVNPNRKNLVQSQKQNENVVYLDERGDPIADNYGTTRVAKLTPIYDSYLPKDKNLLGFERRRKEAEEQKAKTKQELQDMFKMIKKDIKEMDDYQQFIDKYSESPFVGLTNRLKYFKDMEEENEREYDFWKNIAKIRARKEEKTYDNAIREARKMPLSKVKLQKGSIIKPTLYMCGGKIKRRKYSSGGMIDGKTPDEYLNKVNKDIAKGQGIIGGVGDVTGGVMDFIIPGSGRLVSSSIKGIGNIAQMAGMKLTGMDKKIKQAKETIARNEMLDMAEKYERLSKLALGYV